MQLLSLASFDAIKLGNCEESGLNFSAPSSSSEMAAGSLTFVHLLFPTLLLVVVLFLTLLFLRRQRQNHHRRRRLPPSPPSFPLLGHLHLLKPPIHRSLAAISAAHGPVVLLRFGYRPVLLVSSPAAAEECFTVHDVAFANRPRFLAGKILGYDFTSVVWAPYGPLWRDLRRITSVHLLSSGSLRASSDARADEIRTLVRTLFLQHGGGAPRRLDMKSALFSLVVGIIERLVAPLAGDAPDQRRIVREIVTEVFRESAATGNAGDYMPAFMRTLAWRGSERRLMRLHEKRDGFSGALIEQHRERRRIQEEDGGGEGSKTVISIMLSLQNSDPERYTDDIIKGLILVHFPPHLWPKVALQNQIGINQILMDSFLSIVLF